MGDTNIAMTSELNGATTLAFAERFRIALKPAMKSVALFAIAIFLSAGAPARN